MVMGLLASTLLVFTMEFGDKTQVATLIFAAKSRRYLHALLLSSTGFLLANIVPAVVGGLIKYLLVNYSLIMMISGVLFMLVGTYPLIRRGEKALTVTSGSMLAAVFLSELGDKTQISTLALSMTYTPLEAILGATLGYVLSNALALTVLSRILRRIGDVEAKLEKIASLALIGLGLIITIAGLYSLIFQTQ